MCLVHASHVHGLNGYRRCHELSLAKALVRQRLPHVHASPTHRGVDMDQGGYLDLVSVAISSCGNDTRV